VLFRTSKEPAREDMIIQGASYDTLKQVRPLVTIAQQRVPVRTAYSGTGNGLDVAAKGVAQLALPRRRILLQGLSAEHGSNKIVGGRVHTREMQLKELVRQLVVELGKVESTASRSILCLHVAARQG